MLWKTTGQRAGSGKAGVGVVYYFARRKTGQMIPRPSKWQYSTYLKLRKRKITENRNLDYLSPVSSTGE